MKNCSCPTCDYNSIRHNFKLRCTRGRVYMSTDAICSMYKIFIKKKIFVKLDRLDKDKSNAASISFVSRWK